MLGRANRDYGSWSAADSRGVEDHVIDPHIERWLCGADALEKGTHD
jgi:hypothetical protein